MTERSVIRVFWICAAVTLLSALVSAGFSLSSLRGPAGVDSFAQYAASRSLALLLAVLCAVLMRSTTGILFLGMTMTVVQVFDGIIGALKHDRAKTYGPFIFALVNVLAAGWLWRNAH